MLTTTHVLVGAAATTRPGMLPGMMAVGWLGGFVPDASVFLMVAVSRVTNGSSVNMWRKPDGLYWQEPWQTLSAISNSIPLWMGLLVLGLLLFRRPEVLGLVGLGLLVFAGGGLLHVMADFLVHAEDAHVHFWPLTEWRFHSPVSYWQSAYYGDKFRIFELMLNAGLAAYLFWQFDQWPVRILAVLMAAPPLLMSFVARFFF